jgi:hypothetical protein
VPVSAWHAVINENEPGSVQKSASGESQIGVHIHLHLTNPYRPTGRKSLTLLGTQRVFPLTLVVDLSRATDPELGPRWHESNSANNEDNLQHEQQEVHDRSPVSAG